MKRSRKEMTLAGWWVHITCCLIFVAFSFFYLYSFQGEMMQLVQHLMSDGRTSYRVLLFSSLITLTLTVLGLCMEHFRRFPVCFKAMAWQPAFFVLGWLTDVNLKIIDPTLENMGVLPFLLFGLCYLIGVLLLRQFANPKPKRMPLQTLLWPNLLLMAVGMLFTCTVGNTNRKLHYELRMGRYAAEERYNEILEAEEHNEKVTRNTMSLRMYALSRRDELGERLFMFSNNLGSDAILPSPKDSLRHYNLPGCLKDYLGRFPMHDMNATRFLQYVASDTAVATPVYDYLLCALLLDRNLSVFTDSLISFYDEKDSLKVQTPVKKGNTKKRVGPIHFTSLPRHYAEALLLYSQLNENPIAVIDDDKLLENYLEFTSYRETQDSCQGEKLCHRFYNNTYWYYYFF